MIRNLVFVVSFGVIQILSTVTSVPAAEFGTAEEAKAMLERAVAAVKEDKVKALDMFNNGEGGFRGSRSICVVRQRLGRHHHGAAVHE